MRKYILRTEGESATLEPLRTGLDAALHAAAQVHAAIEADTRAKPGRPRRRRQVASRQTVYLDAERHEVLKRMAQSRGTSLHSLIIEGIDHVIGKPAPQGWKPREP